MDRQRESGAGRLRPVAGGNLYGECCRGVGLQRRTAERASCWIEGEPRRKRAAVGQPCRVGEGVLVRVGECRHDVAEELVLDGSLVCQRGRYRRLVWRRFNHSQCKVGPAFERTIVHCDSDGVLADVGGALPTGECTGVRVESEPRWQRIEACAQRNVVCKRVAVGVDDLRHLVGEGAARDGGLVRHLRPRRPLVGGGGEEDAPLVRRRPVQ